MKALLLFSLVLLPLFAGAQQQALENYYNSRVMVLDRPLTVYHYRSGSPEPKITADVLAMMGVSTARFFQRDNTRLTDLVGPGLYTSVDPAATRGYGGSDAPQLIAATLKPGTRVLDTRWLGFGNDMQTFITVAKSAGCFPGTSQAQVQLMTDLRANSLPACREAIMKAFEDLHIQAILYNYDAMELAPCRPVRAVAISVVSVDAFDPASVSFFSNLTKIESSTNTQSLVLSLYNEAHQGTSAFMTALYQQTYQPPTMLDGPSASATDLAQYRDQFIWKCGSLRTKETGPTDNYFRIRLQAMDLAYEQLYTKLIAAYSTKVPNDYFDPTRLRSILRMQYRATKVAPDDSKFDQWVALEKQARTSDPSADRLAALNARDASFAQFFGDNFTPVTQDQMTNSTAALTQDLISTPINYQTSALGYLPSEYMRLTNLSLRSAALYLNSTFAIPYVIDLPPTDPKADTTQLFATNKSTVINILQQCLAQYSDPQQTAAQILSSECGLIPF